VENRKKVKIEKWLGEADIKAYEQFVMQWKNVLEQTREQIQMLLQEAGENDAEKVLALQKQLSMSLLQTYYFTPYGEDFFAGFRAGR